MTTSKRTAVLAEVTAEREAQAARWSGAEKKPEITRAFCTLWILELLPKTLGGTLRQTDDNAWEVRVPAEAFGPQKDPAAYRRAMLEIAAYAVAALEDGATPAEPTLSPADVAVNAVLNRVQTDADLAHLICPLTESFHLLCAAEAARTGEDLDAVRARRIVTRFRFDRRFMSKDEWEELETEREAGA